jgi:hypothetical protein
VAKRGIDNVLGNLLGSVEPDKPPEPAPPAAQAHPAEPLPLAQPPAEVSEANAPARPSRGARRGRPPGSRAGEGKGKVKKTFALDPELYQACVSRSWKEEMQMGEVVEKALRLYLKTPIKQLKE